MYISREEYMELEDKIFNQSLFIRKQNVIIKNLKLDIRKLFFVLRNVDDNDPVKKEIIKILGDYEEVSKL